MAVGVKRQRSVSVVLSHSIDLVSYKLASNANSRSSCKNSPIAFSGSVSCSPNRNLIKWIFFMIR